MMVVPSSSSPPVSVSLVRLLLALASLVTLSFAAATSPKPKPFLLGVGVGVGDDPTALPIHPHPHPQHEPFRFRPSTPTPETTTTATADHPFTIPLQRRIHRKRFSSDAEAGIWAARQGASLKAKYAPTPSHSGDDHQRRSSGSNQLINQNTDSTYFGTIAVGTPPVSLNVILDTGSSDLWLASSTQCHTESCKAITHFDTTNSSTFFDLVTPFVVRYGSGSASGRLGKDTIQFAGFEVKNQVFGVCDVITNNLLIDPVSGLLGLAFEGIAASKATPLWKRLLDAGVWDQPVMSFFLTSFHGVAGAKELEVGGSFTMGSLDTLLYKGDIDYVNLATDTESYWLLPLTELTVQDKAITLPTGASANTAIDTGTTLIGGPAEFLDKLFEQIPGSAPGTGDYNGYYEYPCDTNVTVTLKFGNGRTWTLDPSDFQLIHSDKERCVAAFFKLDIGGSGPKWIVGDTFLKRVYSVFRYDPPSVGFAELSDYAKSVSKPGSELPQPTLDVKVSVTALAGAQSSFLQGAPAFSSLIFILLFMSILPFA